jgi:cell wall-associated NlpC family hydrolase
MLQKIRNTFICTTLLAVLIVFLLPGQEAYAYHNTDDMDAVSLSKMLIDEEYTNGGEDPDEGFNSSGLTYYVFNNIGYDYPRSLDSQYRYGGKLIKDRSDLKYGDALFFGKSGNPSFTGVYIGNGYFVVASKTKDEVVKRYLNNYYREQFIGARRVISSDDHLRVKIILRARTYLGTPYDFGADYGQTRTFDCSSFTKTVFARNGIYLPRVSRDQARRGDYVSKRNLKVGDLVFFSTPSREKYSGLKEIGHVGIYAGNGKMIHTYGKGGVKYGSITSGYWEDKYITARRIID